MVAKHRVGKEVCKDIAQFMLERAKIEESYAKQLMELAKSNYGELETGCVPSRSFYSCHSRTAKTAWNQLKFDIETQAKARQSFATKIVKQVADPITSFKNEQKKMRKNVCVYCCLYLCDSMNPQ
jgi:hypothetical protein